MSEIQKLIDSGLAGHLTVDQVERYAAEIGCAALRTACTAYRTGRFLTFGEAMQAAAVIMAKSLMDLQKDYIAERANNAQQLLVAGLKRP